MTTYINVNAQDVNLYTHSKKRFFKGGKSIHVQEIVPIKKTCIWHAHACVHTCTHTHTVHDALYTYCKHIHHTHTHAHTHLGE